jgi:hypothetical protein
MKSEAFPVSNRKLKELSRYWRDHSYVSTESDPVTGQLLTIERCDFAYRVDFEIRGWLSVAIDSSMEGDWVYFGGSSPWTQWVKAPTLKLALSAIENKVRVSNLMMGQKSKHLEELVRAGLGTGVAGRYVRAELESMQAWAALGRSTLESIGWYDDLFSLLRDPPAESKDTLTDARDRIGPWLGTLCGPPPPPNALQFNPTPSFAFLSGALDEGPHITPSEHAAETFDEEGA